MRGCADYPGNRICLQGTGGERCPDPLQDLACSWRHRGRGWWMLRERLWGVRVCLILRPAALAVAGRGAVRGHPRGRLLLAGMGNGCAQGQQRWGWGFSCLSSPQAAPSPAPRALPCSLPITSHRLCLVQPTLRALPGQAASEPSSGCRGSRGCHALALALPLPCPRRAAAPCDAVGLQPWICSSGETGGFTARGLISYFLSFFPPPA